MSTVDQSADSIANARNLTTEQARCRLTNCLYCALSDKSDTLIDAPTSLGKTHIVASTRWSDYPEITGGQPVIHLHGTKETRREAAEMSRRAGVSYAELESGLDVCPTADGTFDNELSTVDGKLASKWLKNAVNRGGYKFHKAHQMLRSRLGKLPCEQDEGCPSSQRWDDILDDEGEQKYDVIHATYDFAYVEQFVEDANAVFDEQPAFNEEVQNKAEFLKNSVNEVLSQSNDHLSWVNLVDAVLKQDESLLGKYREFLSQTNTNHRPSGVGYIHSRVQDIAEAVARAEMVLDGKRYFGRTKDTLVVLDEQGSLRQVHQSPDLSDARCVIGLDAYPSPLLWRLNTVDDLQLEAVLTPDERTRWRTERRGLHTVQVGRYARPYTRGWRGKHPAEKARVIIGELKRHYGSTFRTSISSKAIEGDVRRMLSDAGVESPETMHFGNLKSRNDFEEESVGLVVGCNDPGDDRILDLLAFCELNALPKLNESGERDYGREFEGPDSDAAAEFLASVRENNLAQAVGRYARDPQDEDFEATVYVWSSALPDSLTDRVVPGVISRLTDLKDEIEQYVRREGTVTKKQVVEEVDTGESYAYEVLQELAEQGIVTVSKGTGYYGADEYQYVSGTLSPSVDLGF